MNMRRTQNMVWVGCFLLLGLMTVAKTTHAQTVTVEQMQLFAPDEQDLQGFTRLRPAGALLPKDIFQNGQFVTMPSPAAQTEDHVQIGAKNADNPPYWQTGRICSRIERTLYSQNGLYELDLTITLYDTAESAQKDLDYSLQSSSSRFERGRFTSIQMIGDESWFLPRNGKFQTLTFRSGKMVVLAEGSRSRLATPDLEFPSAAVEAVAYQILLRASEQTALTGVSVQNARLAVNGHTLPKNALRVAGRVYVPVQEFAKAMGLTSRWNSKTGALTLTGANRKAIALTAGSTVATVGGAKVSALAVPVLKDGGQPVMTLDDLLTLTGGRITSQAGNTMQVKS